MKPFPNHERLFTRRNFSTHIGALRIIIVGKYLRQSVFFLHESESFFLFPHQVTLLSFALQLFKPRRRRVHFPLSIVFIFQAFQLKLTCFFHHRIKIPRGDSSWNRQRLSSDKKCLTCHMIIITKSLEVWTLLNTWSTLQ